MGVGIGIGLGFAMTVAEASGPGSERGPADEGETGEDEEDGGGDLPEAETPFHELLHGLDSGDFFLEGAQGFAGGEVRHGAASETEEERHAHEGAETSQTGQGR
jgi:hypothetical protein